MFITVVIRLTTSLFPSHDKIMRGNRGDYLNYATAYATAIEHNLEIHFWVVHVVIKLTSATSSSEKSRFCKIFYKAHILETILKI